MTSYFDGVLDKWTNTDGSAVSTNGVIDETTHPNTLQLLAGGSLTPVIPILPLPTDHHDYNIAVKFNIPVGGFLSVRWYTTTTGLGTAYELTLDAVTGLGTLQRWVGGAPTLLQADTIWPLDCVFTPGVWYALRISTTNIDANTRAIRILIDGNQAVPVAGTELIDAPGVSPGSGFYLFKNGGLTSVWLDNVESWRNPARFATIETSTLTERGGAVTMTSNFVQ
jgi:hypothetical protein